MTFGRLISLAVHGCENESSCSDPAEAREIKDFALNWLSLTLNQIEDLDLRIRPEL